VTVLRVGPVGDRFETGYLETIEREPDLEPYVRVSDLIAFLERVAPPGIGLYHRQHPDAPVQALLDALRAASVLDRAP
jgi:hypothetical protein